MRSSGPEASSSSPSQRVAARRRVVMRVGLLTIFVLALLAMATACIFDQSDYKGGGRADQGATAVTASAPTDTATDTTTAPTSTTPPAGDIDADLVDAGIDVDQ